MGNLFKIIGFIGIFLLAIYTSLPYISNAKPDYSNNISFKDVGYIDNYDGDTFTVTIPDLPPIFGYKIPIRVAHINTAEIISTDDCEKKAALYSKSKVRSLLKAARKIDIINVKRDKYFRIIADVIIEEDLNLGSYLISEKLAVPYEGEAKPHTDWCQYPPNKPHSKK